MESVIKLGQKNPIQNAHESSVQRFTCYTKEKMTKTLFNIVFLVGFILFSIGALLSHSVVLMRSGIAVMGVASVGDIVYGYICDRDIKKHAKELFEATVAFSKCIYLEDDHEIFDRMKDDYEKARKQVEDDFVKKDPKDILEYIYRLSKVCPEKDFSIELLDDRYGISTKCRVKIDAIVFISAIIMQKKTHLNLRTL